MTIGYKIALEAATLKNENFRKVLYTTSHMQLVLMTLKPGEDIGLERHRGTDQFFRFEKGEGRVVIDDKRYRVKPGDCVVVPVGAQHNVVNISMKVPLTFYTIYALPHHRDGVVRKTKIDAIARKEIYDGKTTE